MSIRAPLTIALASLLCAADASALEPFTERRLTLPARDWSFDVGGTYSSYAYTSVPCAGAPGTECDGPSYDDFGAAFAFAVAPITHLEIGGRQGVDLGGDAYGAAGDASRFATPFDRQTWTSFGQPIRSGFTNPELRITGEVVDHEVFELGLEGRIVLPLFVDQSVFATTFGLPMRFHAGRRVRIDTGVWIPIAFDDGAAAIAFSAPVDVWFQVSTRVWLGPELGFDHGFQRAGADGEILSDAYTNVEAGFGLGIQVHKAIDLKMSLYDPSINQPTANGYAARWITGTFGAQFRVE